MAKHNYKFCFGPWNISEGQDPYGPPVRSPQTFDWKLNALKRLGFDAMMFHDDDAVPDIDSKSDRQLRKESKQLKQKLADAGVVAEIVAPRLWFDPRTIDGATYLLWVAHNLERLADRVTNICERTIFLVTGEQLEMDSEADFA